jgi:hypothetical protein
MSVGYTQLEQECSRVTSPMESKEEEDLIDNICEQSHWSLEDSPQWKYLESIEKEEAVNNWSAIVVEQANCKQYRDK